MSAEPKTPRLSKPQREQLLLLGDKGASSEKRALSLYEPGVNPGSMGALLSRGLIGKKVQRLPGGQQQTIYWLTIAGANAYCEAAGRRAQP